jgi:hypothetical protein
MSESVGSGDGYLAIEDSSLEEDCQFIFRFRNYNNNDDSETKKRRRAGGSRKGKSKNKNRNRRLGHSILIKVRCCCCCFLLIVAFVLCPTLLSYSFYNLHKDYFSGANSTYDDKDFRCRFRMRRLFFEDIRRKVEARDPYFRQKVDCCGELGASSNQKVTAAHELKNDLVEHLWSRQGSAK